MKEIFKPNTEESPAMIVTGIVIMYLLIIGFIIYLYFLNRITTLIMLSSIIIFTLLYLPRLLIIKKIIKKDEIKIIENFIMINGTGIELSDIKNFTTEIQKPKVIFFINNKMIIFQQAKFCLKLPNEEITFTAIGSQKIQLLTEFLNNIVKK